MKTTRLTALLLAVCLSLSLALPCAAAGSAPSLDTAVQAMTALGILTGDGSGNLNLSRRVTRSELTAMAVKASPGGDAVGQAATSPYPDVPRSHWASGYVEAAVSLGLVTAFSDGTFRPNEEVKLAEGVSMALALLGYGPGDFSGAYPSGQMAMYRKLKLNTGVTAAAPTAPLTRQDAACLFYNLLSARTKEGAPYIQSLGYSLDASGKPDIVSLVSGRMDGPLVARSDWRSALSFTPATVYRNGGAAQLRDIQDYDVIYWNEAMGTVWAYGKKATGVIQAIGPDRAAPASVTLAGRTYAIESSAAAYDLSDLGKYHLGDTVTLLLGRSGGVAAVADITASAGEKVGVVVEVSNASYPDGSGGAYTARTVTLLASDGQTYQYQIRGGGQVGAVVRAAVAPNGGEVTLRGLSSATITGKVNREGTMLDKYTFAQGAEILDVSDSRGAVVSPGRLAGLDLGGGKVKYYALNPQGEIETLILNDVTGDAYQYGVLTSFDAPEEGGMGRYYSYAYDIAGTAYTLPGVATRFHVNGGPIRLLGDPANPKSMASLTSAGSGQIVGNQFAAGNQKYTLSDSVLVYELRDGRYNLSSLARAEEDGRTVTAWYDRAESEGGRIRVIVVR